MDCASNTPTELAAVLNLPRGSLITLDGCVIRLQRDDFVGFVDFPQNSISASSFHWLTIRPATPAKPNFSTAAETETASSIHDQEAPSPPRQEYSAIATGFWIASNTFVEQYDPQTEEVGSTAVDKTTRRNLLQNVRQNALDPQRVVRYSNVVSESSANHWRQRTDFISTRLLQRRGVAPCGSKIVAGSYSEDSESSVGDTDTERITRRITDGSPVQFPNNIPVFMTTPAGQKHRIASHVGTKRFLAKLSTVERTQLFYGPSSNTTPADLALERVLRDEYNNHWRDVVGDVQLSYLILVQIQCFAALEHWRDLVAMLCATSVLLMAQHVDLYTAFVTTLTHQMQSPSPQEHDPPQHDLWDDTDLLTGEDSFLIPSLRNLLQNIASLQTKNAPERNSSSPLAIAAESLRTLLQDKFPTHFGNDSMEPVVTEGGDVDENDVDRIGEAWERMNCEKDNREDDDEGPVVVDAHEIESYLNRSQQQQRNVRSSASSATLYPSSLRERYPILFAAVQPHEDVLMTCARALDEATDVSLVRESADYLEQVEAAKGRCG